MFTRNVDGLDRAARPAIGIVLLPTALLLLGGPGGGILGIAATAAGLIGSGDRRDRLLPDLRPARLVDRA